MAVRKIKIYPADILEQNCDVVTRFDKKLAKILNDMYDTMIEFDGVGLAAPQIGLKQRIAIVDIDDDFGTIELMNPEIVEASGVQNGIEGCLSFPKVYGEVTRFESIKVKAQDRKGREFFLEAEGFLARAIQHEVDHLNGILFTSKVTRYVDEKELGGENG
jgi:peptide deformylase